MMILLVNQKIPMRLSQLLQGIYVEQLPVAWADIDIHHIACDSRLVELNSLFIALSGTQLNGADFIMDAVSRGARVVVHAPLTNPVTIKSDVLCLTVSDPKDFLCQVACRFYDYPSNKIKSVGVTGTNGKTTVTYLIESIIHTAGLTCGVIGTVNYRIGRKVLPSKNTTPGLLENQHHLNQLVGAGINYCIMETSSHALDQGRVLGINFSAGIFTNLTQDHLDYHQTMDNYFKAKSILFLNLANHAHAIINTDDPYGQKLLAVSHGQIMTYSIDHHADVMASAINYQLGGTEFNIVYPKGSIEIKSRFIGKHNVYNALAAFAWGLSDGLPLEVIKQGIENLACVPGRLEPVDHDRGFYIYIDYAHTEDGLINVLQALRVLNPKRIILVFGCGGDRDRSKRPKMGAAASALADYSIVTTDNPRSEDPKAIIDEVILGFTKQNYEFCIDRAEAIGRALAMAQKDDIVLIAGKGHEDYQIFKDKTIAFNEREIVNTFLKER